MEDKQEGTFRVLVNGLARIAGASSRGMEPWTEGPRLAREPLTPKRAPLVLLISEILLAQSVEPPQGK